MKALRIVKLTRFDRWYLGLSLPAVAAGAAYLWPGVLTWPHLGILVTIQIAWLATLTLVHAAKVLSWPGALCFSGLACGASWLVESSWMRAAVFGSGYDYAAFLGSHLPGEVPVTIPLMWFGLVYLSFLISNCMLVSSGSFNRALLCGYLMCAFDLLLDPIATGTGTFVWHEPGAYYTTPLHNFIGWFGVGFGVVGGYLLLQSWKRLSPPNADSATHQQVAGLLGGAAFILPMLLAVLIGRPGAAGAFLLTMTPTIVCWNTKGCGSIRATNQEDLAALSFETSAG